MRALSATLIEAPAAPAVSLAEAKRHLNVEHDEDDAIIEAFVAVAVARLDGPTGGLGRGLVTQTWRVAYDRFPAAGDLDPDRLRLPLIAASVTSLDYYDAAGTDRNWAGAGNWTLHQDVRGSYLRRAPGRAWPETAEADDAVRIMLVTGFGDPAAVPPPIRQAILLMVTEMYDRRGTATAPGAVASTQVWTTVEALLADWWRAYL